MNENLSRDIMNMNIHNSMILSAIDTCMVYDKMSIESKLELAYKLGHRDARHEASEMALSVSPTDRYEIEKEVRADFAKQALDTIPKLASTLEGWIRASWSYEHIAYDLLTFWLPNRNDI